MKKRKIIASCIMLILVLALIAINSNKYKNEHVDRFNPILKKTTGYAILPEHITYNNGKKYNLDTMKDRSELQFPDDYNVLVVDSPTQSNQLSFSGGQSPEEKNYAKVEHKGSYVYKIEFIYFEQVPDEIKPYLEGSN